MPNLNSGYHWISIHAPAKGATNGCPYFSYIARFQSTLPRGERRGCPADLKLCMDFNPRSREGSDVMQHLVPFAFSTNFNPRSREGSDGATLPSCRLPLRISIHAPARGATRHALNLLLKKGFQSTLPRGERPELVVLLAKGELFQSTLPRGERLHLLTFFRLQYGSILFHLTNKYSPCF